MTRVEHLSDDIRLILGDCRDVLPTLGRVDAVVTDPPYGINIAARGVVGTSKAASVREYEKSDWDQEVVPPDLMAIVRGAGRWNIIFGGNYYDCPPASCWLVWDKMNTGDFADCELAWTNLPRAVRRIRYMWNGMLRANNEPRGDHPTQKPVGVMSWALQQLPADARTVVDPFMGSGTTGVACVLAGLGFTGIEREAAYFDAACRRIADELKRPRLSLEPIAKPVQEALL